MLRPLDRFELLVEDRRSLYTALDLDSANYAFRTCLHEVPFPAGQDATSSDSQVRMGEKCH